MQRPRRTGRRPGRRPPTPDTLARMLRLEAERGYDNRAVRGGTASLLLNWLQPALARARSLRTRAALAALCQQLADYDDLPRRSRARVIEQCRGLLSGLAAPPATPLSLYAPVTALPGIGPSRGLELMNVGVVTVEDLLLYLPSRYLDARRPTRVRDLEDGQQAVIAARLTRAPRLFPGRRASRVEAPAEDGTGRVILQWFNQPYRAEQFGPGDVLAVAGRARCHGSRMFFVVSRTLPSPVGGLDAAPSGAEGQLALLPEYPAAASVPAAIMRRAIACALEQVESQLRPLVPEAVASRLGLLTRPRSLKTAHLPASLREAELAKRSLAFERLLILQTRLLRHRDVLRSQSAEAVVAAEDLADRMQALLPFTLTSAQRRGITEIAADLRQPRPAHRLIHGDVGSGKTVVAAAAVLAAVDDGRQAALMAPTEILAEQHAWRLAGILEPARVRVHLLTGSLPSTKKESVRQAAARGDQAVFVGTHALIQQAVEFKDLAVIVVDEQHRFGVAQRAALISKGHRPNLFVMSATPIPRTLALALYADFDISVLDELPPGRKPVATKLLTGADAGRAYRELLRRVRQGQQGFVVCPLIDPSPALEAEAAEQLFERLSTGPLAEIRLGLVHGRMPTVERQQVMQAFYEHGLDALVSTTVIEVGLDVPNASVILVQNAERFGLAQLHQLRGRVARSRHHPLCLLIAGDTSPRSRQRLDVLVRHSDGFRIAEADLRMRGAGELAGLRQHGPADWVAGDILAYPDLLAAAHEAARAILDADPQLSSREHRPLAEAIEVLGQVQEGRWAL